MKKRSRLMNFLLIMIMAVSLLPAGVRAEETDGETRTEEDVVTTLSDAPSEQMDDTEGRAEEPSDQKEVPEEEKEGTEETSDENSEEKDGVPENMVQEPVKNDPDGTEGEKAPEKAEEEEISGEAEESGNEDPEAELTYTEVDCSAYILQSGGLLKGTKTNSRRRRSLKDSAPEADIPALAGKLYEAAAAWDGTSSSYRYYFGDDEFYTGADVQSAFMLFLNENPDLFYVKNTYSLSSYDNGIAYYITIGYDTAFSLNNINIFKNKVSQILSGVSGSWSDEQKALYLHDYLVTHCEYDLTYSNYDAYDCMVTGSSVCQGYSLSYKYLMNQCGLECSIVSSDAMTHAWNLAKVGGNSFYVDCTYDDPTTGNNTLYQDYCRHSNFLRSKAGITGTGHNSTDWVDSYGNDLYNNDPVSSAYEGAWWSGSASAVAHVGRFWAYVKADGKTVAVHDYAEGTDTDLFTLSDGRWPVWDQPGYSYSTGFAHVASYGGYFYVSSPKKIYRFTTEETAPEEIYALTDGQMSQGYIYGIHTEGNTLYYRLYTSNNAGTFAAEYTISPLEAMQEDSWAAFIRKATASFEGRMVLNFYLQLPEEVLEDEDAYVSIKRGDEELQFPVADAENIVENGETLYIFSCPVYAYEFRDTVNLKLYDGAGEVVRLTNVDGTNDYTETGVDYSMMTYCTKMINSGTASDEMKALARAAIDYGTAAQIQFDHNADGLAVSDAVTAVTTDALQGYKAAVQGSLPQGISGRTLTALFREDNSLRLYFAYRSEADPDAYTYMIDGEAAELKTKTSGNSDYRYLEVSNVSADALGDTHTFHVNDSTGAAYDIDISVMTYARASVVNGDEKAKNLGKALYLYYQAAAAKFRN